MGLTLCGHMGMSVSKQLIIFQRLFLRTRLQSNTNKSSFLGIYNCITFVYVLKNTDSQLQAIKIKIRRNICTQNKTNKLRPQNLESWTSFWSSIMAFKKWLMVTQFPRQSKILFCETQYTQLMIQAFVKHCWSLVSENSCPVYSGWAQPPPFSLSMR